MISSYYYFIIIIILTDGSASNRTPKDINGGSKGDKYTCSSQQCKQRTSSGSLAGKTIKRHTCLKIDKMIN